MSWGEAAHRNQRTCKTLPATEWLDFDRLTWAFLSTGWLYMYVFSRATLLMTASSGFCLAVEDHPSTICWKFWCSNCSAATWLDRLRIACSSSWVIVSWVGGCAIYKFSRLGCRSGLLHILPIALNLWLVLGTWQPLLGLLLVLFGRHDPIWTDNMNSIN